MKKYISYFFIFFIFFMCSCSTSKKNYKPWSKLIEGEWKLVEPSDQVNYPTIEFIKKDATFNSFADTIFYYSYKLKENDLILNDGINSKRHNKIIQLTQDSLIFETLLKKPTHQVYLRV